MGITVKLKRPENGYVGKFAYYANNIQMCVGKIQGIVILVLKGLGSRLGAVFFKQRPYEITQNRAKESVSCISSVERVDINQFARGLMQQLQRSDLSENVLAHLRHILRWDVIFFGWKDLHDETRNEVALFVIEQSKKGKFETPFLGFLSMLVQREMDAEMKNQVAYRLMKLSKSKNLKMSPIGRLCDLVMFQGDLNGKLRNQFAGRVVKLSKKKHLSIFIMKQLQASLQQNDGSDKAKDLAIKYILQNGRMISCEVKQKYFPGISGSSKAQTYTL